MVDNLAGGFTECGEIPDLRENQAVLFLTDTLALVLSDESLALRLLLPHHTLQIYHTWSLRGETVNNTLDSQLAHLLLPSLYLPPLRVLVKH